MTDLDEGAARRFFASCVDRANEINAQTHVGADVKLLIAQLIQVAETFRELIDAKGGQSGDVRVARAKLSEAKQVSKRQEDDLSEMRKMILSLATEIEMVNVDAGQIIKRKANIKEHPDAEAAHRIQAAAKRITDVVLHLSKKNSEALKVSQAK